MTRDFRDEIIIDKFDLDNEASKNGERVIYWSDQWAKAEKEKEEAERELESVRGILELEIRRNPKLYDVPKDAKGFYKTTDSIISSCIYGTDEYQEAYKDLIKAKEIARKLQNVRNVFMQRKDLIREIIRLYMAEYFHQEEGYASPGSIIEKEVIAKRKENIERKVFLGRKETAFSEEEEFNNPQL